MATGTKTFSAVNQTSATLALAPGVPATIVITGTFVATLLLESSINNGATWETAATYTAAQTSTPLPVHATTSSQNRVYRVRCSSYTAGSPVVTLADGAVVVALIKGVSDQVALEVDSDGLASPILKSPSGSGTPAGKLTYDPGRYAVNTLRVAASVASAETVTIGADVYEVEIVNTDSTDTTANSDFNNTTNPLTLATFTTDYPEVTVIALGNLIRIGTEILRVTLVNGTSRTFRRGASGTTTATHANAAAIYMGDGIAGGSTIAVGLVTTLTPTAFTPALVADINAVGTSAVTATQISVNEMLLQANAVGAVVLATTETLAGANNAWNATAMYGGAAQVVRTQVVQARVPLAQEVTLGHLQFLLPFTPTLVQVLVAPTATPGAYKIWDGAVTIASGLVTLDNSGSTDWAATDTVTVIAQA